MTGAGVKQAAMADLHLDVVESISGMLLESYSPVIARCGHNDTSLGRSANTPSCKRQLD